MTSPVHENDRSTSSAYVKLSETSMRVHNSNSVSVEESRYQAPPGDQTLDTTVGVSAETLNLGNKNKPQRLAHPPAKTIRANRISKPDGELIPTPTDILRN